MASNSATSPATRRIDGEFFGPIQISNIAQTTQFNSSRTDLTILKLRGRLDLDSDSLQISDVDGSIKLKTHDKSIELENATGRIDINNAHADVSISLKKSPSDEINVQNDSGGIDLSLPSKSAFEINAASRSGEIESEFDDSALNHATVGRNQKARRQSGRITARRSPSNHLRHHQSPQIRIVIAVRSAGVPAGILRSTTSARTTESCADATFSNVHRIV